MAKMNPAEDWISLGGKYGDVCEVNGLGVMRYKANKRCITWRQDIAGYVVGTFFLNHEQTFISQHCALALTHIPNNDPITKTTVDHANRIKNDNRLENLNWVTPSEQRMNQTRPDHEAGYRIGKYTESMELLAKWDNAKLAAKDVGAGNHTILKKCREGAFWRGGHWFYMDTIDPPSGEMWVRCRGKLSFAWVSNHGRVRRGVDGVPTRGYFYGGYYYTSFVLEGVKKNYAMHYLTLSGFEGIEVGKEPNHINGDKEDNHLWNLEWLTRSENTKHALDTGLRQTRAILKCLPDGTEVMRYKSRNEAARQEGVIPGTIRHRIKRGKPINGFLWKNA